MTNKSKIIKGLAGVNNIVSAITVLGVALEVAQPAIDAISKPVKEMVEERKALVDIPDLYSKGYPIKLDRAKLLLEDRGLKVEPVSITDASIKYKDCFDLQVVDSKPKHKQKVKPGTLVYLKHVTSGIIEESKKLFDESEKHKAELKQKKTNNRLEQKEKTKQIVNGVVINIQQSAIDITAKTKNQIKIVRANVSRKNMSEEHLDDTNDS